MAAPLTGAAQNGPTSSPFVQIARDATSSVVKIASVQDQHAKGHVFYGSGFLISPDGYLITNSHVVGGGDHISVFFEHQEVEALLVTSWPDIDIAILKIDGSHLPYLTLGDSDHERPLPCTD